MIHVARSVLLAAVLVAAPCLASAQQGASRVPRRPSGAAVDRAVATITEADVGTKLGALAHDSTRGRETPSPELARAADWIAARFRAAGLRPAGDGGGYLQHFRLRHTQVDTLTIAIAAPRHWTRWTVGRDFVFAGGQPAALQDLPVVLMAGVPADTARPFGAVPVRNAVVLVVLAPDQIRGPVINPIAGHAGAEGVAAIVFVAALPPERWAPMQHLALPSLWTLADAADRAAPQRMVAYIAQLESAADLLRAAGEDPATVLTPERRGIRTLANVTFSAAVHETTVEGPPVANVVGVLQGSDRSLREEAVVFTAHYDHVGVLGGGLCEPSRALPADSICNGADDNASGTVGVMEIAEAFAALNPRPARTLVFAALAAGERGFFGARYHLEHPVVPVERTAAVINLDMISRNARDTVGLVGKDYSSLGAVVDRTAREHPELRLTPRDSGGYYSDSDHFALAQRGVPALFFCGGGHPDEHTTADNVDRVDVAQATRIARLAFLVGVEVASAADRPVWDPQARTRVGSP